MTEQRTGLQLPKPDDILDAIVDDYARTMEAQGHVLGVPERAAVRRMANIHYAFYCAIARSLQ